MLSIEMILGLIASSVAIIIIIAGTWIYLLIRKDDWKDYSDSDPKDDNQEYEKFMENYRAGKIKSTKANFNDDIPF